MIEHRHVFLMCKPLLVVEFSNVLRILEPLRKLLNDLSLRSHVVVLVSYLYLWSDHLRCKNFHWRIKTRNNSISDSIRFYQIAHFINLHKNGMVDPVFFDEAPKSRYLALNNVNPISFELRWAAKFYLQIFGYLLKLLDLFLQAYVAMKLNCRLLSLSDEPISIQDICNEEQLLSFLIFV